MVKDQRTDYKRAFNEKNYARLNITIPKGQKQAVEAHAKSKRNPQRPCKRPPTGRYGTI